MRAALCSRYGPPEVLSVGEVPRPEVGDDELLIRVTSSTVNRTCSGIRSATPQLAIRLMYGLRRPRQPILGSDFAGVVEQCGDDARGFDVGDRVFGFDDRRLGAHGEFMVLPAKAGIASIPDGVSDDEAAAAVEGAHYALTNLDRAGLVAGQRALVYGGGGAIGTAAVQLLAARGIDIVAVAEAHQLDLMKSLGARRTIDYRAEDFTALGETFDFVFDAVGKTTFAACKGLLHTDGMFMATEIGPGLQNLRLALTTRFGGGPTVHFPFPLNVRAHVKTTADELAKGTFRPVIDRVFDLDQVQDAYRFVETATKTGNVILRISPPVVPRVAES